MEQTVEISRPGGLKYTRSNQQFSRASTACKLSQAVFVFLFFTSRDFIHDEGDTQKRINKIISRSIYFSGK